MSFTFNRFDLSLEDQKKVGDLADEQAIRIYQGQNRNGRRLSEICKNSEIGMVVEMFIARKRGWTISTDNDYDLIDEKDRNIEIKSCLSVFSMKDKPIVDIIEKYERGSNSWSKIDRIIFFRHEEQTDGNGLFWYQYTYVGSHKMIRRNKITPMKGKTVIL